jgi:undecaprenyl diphosphate synthase
MDGNKRWAKKNQKKTYDGYVTGLNNLKTLTEECIRMNISYLTVFALSSENIHRNNSVIIFNIIRKVFKNLISDLYSKKINLNIIGEKEGIPEDILQIFEKKINKVQNPAINLNVAFNYGTQYELKKIVNSIILSKSKNNLLDKIRSNMYLGSIPDPEILIRTGGFQRLSNFMLLNLSYTELFFTKTLWPDFSIKEFNEIIKKFSNIQRNYGL